MAMRSVSLLVLGFFWEMDGRSQIPTTRDWLYGVFESWMVEKGLDIHQVVYANPPNVTDFGSRCLLRAISPVQRNNQQHVQPSTSSSKIDATGLGSGIHVGSHHTAVPLQILVAFPAYVSLQHLL